jgi:hypothetical protein
VKSFANLSPEELERIAGELAQLHTLADVLDWGSRLLFNCCIGDRDECQTQSCS